MPPTRRLECIKKMMDNEDLGQVQESQGFRYFRGVQGFRLPVAFQARRRLCRTWGSLDCNGSTSRKNARECVNV